MEISNSKNTLPFKTNMTPVVLINQIVLEQKQLSTQLDLTSAVVPLSLHTGDKNLIMDSLVSVWNKTFFIVDFFLKKNNFYLLIYTHKTSNKVSQTNTKYIKATIPRYDDQNATTTPFILSTANLRRFFSYSVKSFSKHLNYSYIKWVGGHAIHCS